MKGKFLTTAILAALLVGSNAMASIARQAVLGNQPVFTAAGSGVNANEVNGSLWYDDDYNVFFNPAYINDNKNYVTLSKGFEAGYFKGEFENFAYGIYLNRGGNGNAESIYGANFVAPGDKARASFIGTATALNTQRPIDFFIGGDTGIKWGFHAAWAYNRDQLGASQPNNASSEVTNRYWHFDLGAEVMGFEPFIGTTVLSNYQNNTAAPASGQLNEFTAGFRYKYEGWSPYAVFHQYREGGLPVGATTQVQTRMNNWGVGVGHDTKVADGVHVLKHLGFFMSSVVDDAGAVGATADGTAVTADANKDYKDYILPLNVAIEAEALSWLTLRAGATYNLWAERKYTTTSAAQGSTTAIANLRSSLAANTTVRIGSTMKFGKLHVDSAFGNGAVAGAGGENLDTSAVGFDSQTFALLSASYHW